MNGLVSAIKTDIGYSIVPRCMTTGTFTEANTRQIAIGCEGIGFEKNTVRLNPENFTFYGLFQGLCRI